MGREKGEGSKEGKIIMVMRKERRGKGGLEMCEEVGGTGIGMGEWEKE